MTAQEKERILLGSRIRQAREALSWSQGRLAKGVGFSSAQTISSIETGQRDLKAWELFRIAKALYVSVENLLRGEHSPVAPVEWRGRSKAASKEVEARFLERCKRFKLLEDWCEVSIPQELNLLPLGGCPSFEQVQNEGDKIRRYMQLGGKPALSLGKTLEEDYGVKIFHDDLGEQGAALSARGPFGLAVLLNSGDAPWRRNFSLAHELFHLLLPAETLSVDADRLEQLANVFASQLLLPAAPVLKFLDVGAKEGKISYSDLIDAAREFSVSTEAMLWRLVNLGRTPREAVPRVLADEGFRTLDRSSFPRSALPSTLPDRYVRLAFTAYRKGKVGLAKLAELLETNMIDLADDVVGVEAQESAEHQVPIA